MKKQTIGKAKKAVWKQFSRYIRLRDAVNGYVKCCTCGTTKNWKEMQAGHFIPRAQGNAVYFDERNVHPQCFRCNVNLGGNGSEYYPYMLERYGQETIEELRQLRCQALKFTTQDLKELGEKYKQLADELESDHEP
jgi:5-methylcytosine-specific restriction endonuclease McrA